MSNGAATNNENNSARIEIAQGRIENFEGLYGKLLHLLIYLKSNKLYRKKKNKIDKLLPSCRLTGQRYAIQCSPGKDSICINGNNRRRRRRRRNRLRQSLLHRLISKNRRSLL